MKSIFAFSTVVLILFLIFAACKIEEEPTGQYTLTVISGGNGSTTPSGNVTVDHGSAKNISATPATGYQFVNWTVVSGTGATFGNANSANTTVTLTGGDATIQANFEADYIGTWFGSNFELPDSSHVDLKLTLRADGTYEALQYDVDGSTLQDMSHRGTYTCANNILYTTSTEIYYTGSEWTSEVQTYGTPYSISGNTLTMYLDFDPDDPDDDATWILTRQ